MSERAPYHHGDLPAALLRAVGEIVDEEGVGGVTLRAVARRVGVSHAAPAHHFGDRPGLLAAYAAEGFDALLEVMRDAIASVGPAATVADALGAMGAAYVRFGLERRAYYEVMWRKELLDCTAPDLVAGGGCAFAALLATLRAALDEQATDADVLALAMTCWSTTHGFVSLSLDMPSAEVEHLPDPQPMLGSVLELLLAGLASHPRWVGHDRPASGIPADLTDPLVELAEVPLPA